MNLRPLNDIVLCERILAKNETKGGIYLPLPRQKALAKVLRVGRGILIKKTGKYDTCGIEEGDIVLFETHRGIDVVYEGNKYLFLSLNNILAVYKKEDLDENGKMDINIDVENNLN